MKTLIAATVLALSANAASAFDWYDGFSGPDTVPGYDISGGADFPTSASSGGDGEVSLYGLLAGNPDSDNGPIPGYVPIVDPTVRRYSSLDLFTYGNPDSGTDLGIEPDPFVENRALIMNLPAHSRMRASVSGMVSRPIRLPQMTMAATASGACRYCSANT